MIVFNNNFTPWFPEFNEKKQKRKQFHILSLLVLVESAPVV